MRNRVPRRILALGFLLALLCLLPAVTPVANARPIGWDIWGDNPTPGPDGPPKGDNDGGVLAKSFARPATLESTGTTGKVTAATSIRVWTDARTVYRHAGLRGLLTILRLDGWLLELR